MCQTTLSEMSVNPTAVGIEALLVRTCTDIVRVQRCVGPLVPSLHTGWKAPLMSAANALPAGTPNRFIPTMRKGSSCREEMFQDGGKTIKRRSSTLGVLC